VLSLMEGFDILHVVPFIQSENFPNFPFSIPPSTIKGWILHRSARMQVDCPSQSLIRGSM